MEEKGPMGGLELCVYKNITINLRVAERGRYPEMPKDHPLYKCKNKCNGYDRVCYTHPFNPDLDGYKQLDQIHQIADTHYQI